MAETAMTYLLAWNPRNFSWDELDDQVAELAKTGGADSWWSTGSVKNIPVGSRVFLIRLGADPRGLVGSGYTTGEVVEREHWLPERRAAGDVMNRVPIRFDYLSRSPLVRRTELESDDLRRYKWDTQMSGVKIPAHVAAVLETLWRARVENSKRGIVAPAVLPADVERWRGYLTSALADAEYIERHSLRDKRRADVQPQIRTLVAAFGNGTIGLHEFKDQFHIKSINEWEIFGLKGFAGAMFLNQIAKNVPDQDGAAALLRRTVVVPKNIEDARGKINELSEFLEAVLESGAIAHNLLKPTNAAFFLSACWHALEPKQWPTFYPSARKALQSDGLLGGHVKGADGYVAFVPVFSELTKALGIGFWDLEHLCDSRYSTGLVTDDDELDEVATAPARARVWLVAPGPRALMFDQFYDEGVIGIGWPEVGDLSQFADIASVKAAIQAHRGGDVSPVQDAYACYQFVHEMQIGDLVFAKKGRHEIVGHGIVTGEYRYDKNRGEYPNTRTVDWRGRGSWKPREKALVTKTLTDVGKYPQLVSDLKSAVGLSAGTGPEVEPPTSTVAIYTIDQACDDLFAEGALIEQAVELLKHKKNLVLQGPPGVGKTYFAKHLAYLLMEEQDNARVRQIQFHQSYSYEDFVQGYRPNLKGQFDRVNGTFLRFCDEALQDSEQAYVLIIDEINRGNLSKIFGELMMLIEADKRSEKWSVELTYGREDEEKFYVPENLHIIGTMNTADRSLAMVDYALRRRFVFVDLVPGFDSPGFRGRLKELGVSGKFADRMIAKVSALNGVIRQDHSLGEGFCLGHSYFCQKPQDQDEQEWFARIVRTELAPLLREYWFDSKKKADDEVARLLES